MPNFPDIPGYRIKKKLGQGGMADVYLGVQENFSRLVAIKILSTGIFQPQGMSKRFLSEARTLSRLNHPNIVTIHEVGQADNCYFFVMEYLQDNLKDKIKKRGMEPQEALHIVKQIADALFYAHKKGIIHRDIKPDNILLRRDNTPVILDFGIAKAMDSNTKLTKTGKSIGTPLYMSPEQCNAMKLDGRSDIYSLGVVLYEMLTGKPPYNARDTIGIVMKHLHTPVPALPGDLKRYQPIIARMMAKEISKRIRSGIELNKIIKETLNANVTKQPGKTGSNGITGIFKKLINFNIQGMADSSTTQAPVQGQSNNVNLEHCKIFISYAKEDLFKVKHIYEALKSAGYDPWLDVAEISAGQTWEYEIEKAIEESCFFLACLSKKSVNKIGYIQRELKIGLKILEKYPEGRIFLIPIRLEQCDIPMSLKNIQWCDVFEDNGIEKLLKAIDRSAVEYGLFWFSAHVLNGPNKGKEFKIPSHHITIGRDGKNNICLTDPKISTLHAKIELRRGKVIFSQMGKKNPSVIRSEMETIKLEASDKRDCLLKNGDIIMMGETQLMVRIKSTGDTSKRIVTTEDVDICINFENL